MRDEQYRRQRHQPGGMYWHLDRPDYDEVRADTLETLAVMLWEEMVYLRRTVLSLRALVSPERRGLGNIRTMTHLYRWYTQKDVRPQRLWDQGI